MIGHAWLNHAQVPPRLPLRTCVGCRQRGPVSKLLRVVAVASADGFVLRPDSRRTLPGRGAHLHLDPGCLESALRRRAFGRALRVTGVFDAGELDEAITGRRRLGDQGPSGPEKTVGGAPALPKE